MWQHFSGLQHYEPRLPCDAAQVSRFLSGVGEAGVEETLKATIDTAVAMRAIRLAELERIIVDTTVQEKAVAHPTNSRLLEASRRALVKAAKDLGVQLKQTYAREGKGKASGCAGEPAVMGMRASIGACAGSSSASAR